jgi:hypothetical protein
MDESKPLLDVSLILRGELLDPAQVTSMLGIAGSKMRKKGEKWRTSTNHEVTAKIGFWAVDAKRESMALHDQISSLRQHLASATCSPLRIPGVDLAEISVFIALGSNDHGGGDYECQLTPEDLGWISSLGVTVSFTLTYVHE